MSKKEFSVSLLLLVILILPMFFNSATATMNPVASLFSSGEISTSTRLIGAMNFDWTHFKSQNVALIKASGANTVKALMYANWWQSNVINYLTPSETYQSKHIQIVQWAHNNGMKFWLECFSFDWNPPEGWDQMKADVILNTNGKGDAWINGFGQMIQTLKPDIVGVMNEPGVLSGTSYAGTMSDAQFFIAYEAFVNRAINYWMSLDSNLVFSVGAQPFWDFARMAANPINHANVFYDAHYYYSYDGSYPPSWATDQIAYWNGNLAQGKTLLNKYFLNTMNIQAMLNKNLTVVLGEVGTCNTNPNALVFMQDLFDLAKAHNMGVIQEIFRPYSSDFPTGILNSDWTTLNTLGQLWASNMQA